MKATKTQGSSPDFPDLDFLKSHSLFGGLTDEQLRRLRARIREESFSSGTLIFREGDLGDCLYFIRRGEVEIVKRVPGGKEERITLLKDGDTFGELELIDIQPRRASARALKKTTALVLTNRVLYLIEKKDPRLFALLIMNMAREIGRHLREYEGPPPQ